MTKNRTARDTTAISIESRPKVASVSADTHMGDVAQADNRSYTPPSTPGIEA